MSVLSNGAQKNIWAPDWALGFKLCQKDFDRFHILQSFSRAAVLSQRTGIKDTWENVVA